MAQEPTLSVMNRFDRQLTGLIAALDINLIGRETSRTIAQLKTLSRDARLDVRDWELSKTRAEMDENAHIAHIRLEDLRAQILKASEHGIFSAITVVDLSSQLDAIQADLG